MKIALVLVAVLGLTALPTVSAYTSVDDLCRDEPTTPGCEEHHAWWAIVAERAWFVWSTVCVDLPVCQKANEVLGTIGEVEDEVSDTEVVRTYWEVRRTLIPDSCPSSPWTCPV